MFEGEDRRYASEFMVIASESFSITFGMEISAPGYWSCHLHGHTRRVREIERTDSNAQLLREISSETFTSS